MARTMQLMLRIGAKMDSSYKTNTAEASKRVKRLATAASLAMSAAYAYGAKTAASFQDHMANVDTLLDDHSHLKGYSSYVKKVANETGISLNSAADGMYETISTLGDHGKKTEKIYRTIAIAAKAGGVSVKDSADLIATAMNGYGKSTNAAAQKISDLSFKAVKLGKTTFPELAQSMAPLFPLGKSLGLTYEELYASMATATTSFSGNTAEASTAIKGAMTAFIKPSTDMQKLLEKNGYSSGAALIKAKGLAGAIKLVQKEAGSDGMSKYFKNVRGLTAALGLSGSGMKRYEKNLKEMQKAHGSTADAMKRKEQSLSAQWGKMRNSLKIIMADLALPMVETLTPIVAKIAGQVEKLFDKFQKLPKPVQKAISGVALALAAIGPALIIFAKIHTGIQTVKTAFAGFKLLSKIKAIGPALKALISGPWGIAIAAVVVGLILVIKYHKQIKVWMKKTWAAAGPYIMPIVKAVKKLGAALLNLWTTILRPIFKGLWKYLKKGFTNSPFAKSFVWLRKHQKQVSKVFKVFLGILKTVAKFMGFGLYTAILVTTKVIKVLAKVVRAVYKVIAKVFGKLKSMFGPAWSRIWKKASGVFKSIWGGIGNFFKGVINTLIGGMNVLIKGLNKIHIPDKKWIPKAFRGAGFNIPTIPTLYKGTTNWPGGPAEVNEPRYGGEIINLPTGSDVIPHDISEKMVSGSMTITYSPRIVISGSASKQDIEEAEEISFRKFEKLMAKYQHRRAARSFRSGAYTG